MPSTIVYSTSQYPLNETFHDHSRQTLQDSPMDLQQNRCARFDIYNGIVTRLKNIQGKKGTFNIFIITYVNSQILYVTLQKLEHIYCANRNFIQLFVVKQHFETIYSIRKLIATRLEYQVIKKQTNQFKLRDNSSTYTNSMTQSYIYLFWLEGKVNASGGRPIRKINFTIKQQT